MSVILIPADTRPHTLDMPSEIAKIMGVTVIVPPKVSLPYFNTPGDVKKLHSWIQETFRTSFPSALIVNLETLTLGGMIPARRSDDPESTVMERLRILEDIHHLYPKVKIYAHGIIPRVAHDNDPYEEKDYYGKYGDYLRQYSELTDKASLGDESAKRKIDSIDKMIPKDILDNYLETRYRDVNLLHKAIDYLSANTITYLAITLDDTSEYGLSSIDRRNIEKRLDELHLWDRADIYPGADEVSSLLIAKSTLDSSHLSEKPKAYIMYTSATGAKADLLYEDLPLGELVKANKRAAGLKQVNMIEDADVIIAVNSPSKRQAEASAQPDLENVENENRYVASFVDNIKEAISTGKPVVVVDVAYANGCDNSFIKQLLNACDVTKLAGLSGWNTAGNSIGSGMAMAIASLFKKDEDAKLELLLLRLVDDWKYQANIRDEARKQLGNPSPYHLGDQKEAADKLVHDLMAPEIKNIWKNHFEKELPNTRMRINRVDLFWPRLFCMGLNLNVNTRSKPIPELEMFSEKSERQKPVSLGESVDLSKDIKDAAHRKYDSTGTPLLRKIMEKALLDNIMRVIPSDQIDTVQNNVRIKNGRATWEKTHFILAMDCSGSMNGVRWESLMCGYNKFLEDVAPMRNIVISSYSFDDNVNPHNKEATVEEAIKTADKVPFTAKGTNYENALEHANRIIGSSKHKDYITCLIFLSDGLCLYPEVAMEKLKALKDGGRKILFYTIACVNEDDEELIKMAVKVNGEHLTINDAMASRLAFSAVLKL